MGLKLNKLNYEDIRVGDIFSFEKLIDSELVNKFADLSEDKNPLHIDESYAKKTKFGGRIAHGMLLSSFFSALVGMLCPGEKSLYLSQTLNFRKPVALNTKVIVEGRVTAKSDAARLIELETKIKNLVGEVMVDGLARVRAGVQIIN